MKIFLIYGVLFIALFGGLIESLGVPAYFTAVTELFIILLFLTSPLTTESRRGYVTHLWYFYFYFLLIAVFSLFVNDSGIDRAIYSLRLLFRFYIFYLAITTLDLDDEIIKRINKVIIFLLILQLPVIAYNFLRYGVSERTIGAYTLVGGAVTTILPIVLIFYIAGFYFFYRNDKRYILLAVAFLLFSIIGKKRVIFFLYPAQFMAIYYFIYLKAKRIHLSRKMSTIVVVLTTIVMISSTILYLNPTLNPEQEVGGSIDPEYAIAYAKDYTTRENPFGYTTGRYATTVRIFKSLWEDGFIAIFLGLGPGKFTQSLFDPIKQRKSIDDIKNRYKFKYGLTAMTRTAIEYGIFGIFTFVLITFSYARMTLRYYRQEVDKYWKAFAAGSVGFAYATVFFFFTYGDTVLWGDTIPALYFWAMAAIYTRSKRLSGDPS
jgi:hypothetical protein